MGTSARSVNLPKAEDRARESLADLWRVTRFGRFSQFAGDGPLRILDVGGTPKWWTQSFNHAPPRGWHVTVLSRRSFADDHDAWMYTITGDPRALPFEDKSFDIVFSNSVIEHVGRWSDQRRMADEVQRVGSRYFVRTRNRYFPVAPGVRLPGVQFLPIQVRAWLMTRQSSGPASRRPIYAEARRYASSTRLLSVRELRRLFPQCHITRERAGVLTKSIIAHS